MFLCLLDKFIDELSDRLTLLLNESNETVLNKLNKMGVNYVQGYHIDMPEPLSNKHVLTNLQAP